MDNKLRRQGVGMIVGLGVQFLLGIAINLFVHFPENQGPKAEWDFAGNNWLVIMHIILGTLLLLGAIVLVARAIRARSSAWKVPAIVALFSLILAWAGGDIFVTTQADDLSFVMSVGFIFGMLAYGWGLIRSTKQLQKV